MCVRLLQSCLSAQDLSCLSWQASCKAIVYSQFWQHVHLIEMYLKLHSVPLVVLRENMKVAEKSAALHTFKVGSACHVLVRTGQPIGARMSLL